MKKKAGLLDYILTDPFTTSSDHWRKAFDETLNSIQSAITSLAKSLQDSASGKLKPSKEQLQAELKTLEAIITFLKSWKNEPKYGWEIDKIAFNPDGTVKTKYLIDTLSSSLFSLYSCTLKQFHGEVTASILAFGKVKKKKETYKDYDEFLDELDDIFSEKGSDIESLLYEIEKRKSRIIKFLYESQLLVSSLVLNRIFDVKRERVVLHQLKSIVNSLDKAQVERATFALRSLFCAIASGGLAANRACLFSLGSYLGILGEITMLEKAMLKSGREGGDDEEGGEFEDIQIEASASAKGIVVRGGRPKSRKEALSNPGVVEIVENIYKKAYSRLLFLAQALYILYPVYTEGKDKFPKCGRSNIAPALVLMKTYLDRIFKDIPWNIEANISDTPEGIASGAAVILTYFIVDTVWAKISETETDRVYSEFYGIADYITGDVGSGLEDIKSSAKAFFEEVKTILKEITGSRVKKNTEQSRNVSGSVSKFAQESPSVGFETEGVDDEIVEWIHRVIKDANVKSIPKELEDRANEILNKAFGSGEDNVLLLFYRVAAYHVVLQDILSKRLIPDDVKEKVIGNIERSIELFNNLKAKIESLLLYIDKIILSAEKGQGTKETEKIKRALVSKLSEVRKLKEKAVNEVKSVVKKILPDFSGIREFPLIDRRIATEIIKRTAEGILRDRSLVEKVICPVVCKLDEWLETLDADVEGGTNIGYEELGKRLISKVFEDAGNAVVEKVHLVVNELMDEIDDPTVRRLLSESLKNIQHSDLRDALKIVFKEVIDKKMCKCIGGSGETKSGSLTLKVGEKKGKKKEEEKSKRKVRKSPRPGYDEVVRSAINFDNFARTMLIVGDDDDNIIKAALKAAVVVDPILYRFFSNLISMEKRFSDPKKKVSPEAVRGTISGLKHALLFLRGSESAILSTGLWGGDSPYSKEVIDNVWNELTEILSGFVEILEKYKERWGNVAGSEKEPPLDPDASKKCYELAEKAKKAIEEFISTVANSYAQYLIHTQYLINLIKSKVVEVYKKNSDNLLRELKKKPFPKKLKSLNDFSKILQEAGIDEEGALLNEIHNFATGILNDKTLGNVTKLLEPYRDTLTSWVENFASLVTDIILSLEGFEKGEVSFEKVQENVNKLVEFVSSPIDESRGKTLEQLKEDLEELNINKVYEVLKVLYSTGEKLKEKLKNLESEHSVFGFSKISISGSPSDSKTEIHIEVLDKVISQILETIQRILTIDEHDLLTLLKQLKNFDKTIDALEKIVKIKQASVGDDEDDETEDEAEDEIEDEASEEEGQEEGQEESEKPTPARGRGRSAPAKRRRKRDEGETGTGRTRSTVMEALKKLTDILSSVGIDLSSVSRFVNNLLDLNDYAGNLADIIKIQYRTYFNPIYFLIAKDLGIEIDDVEKYKKLTSKILDYVDLKSIQSTEVGERGEEGRVEPEKVEAPEPEVVEERTTRPEETVIPESRREEVEEEITEPEVPQTAEEVEEEAVETVEPEEVQAPEAEEVVEEEQVQEVGEAPETRPEAEEVEEGVEEETTEVKPEVEEEVEEEVVEAEPEIEEEEQVPEPISAEEIVESLQESVVGGATVEELEQLESGSDEDVISKVSKVLSEKVSKGEIPVATELRLLYPILYVVVGKELADLVVSFYGASFVNFVSFSVGVKDEEELRGLLDPENLSPEERRVISEIQRRIKEDKEITDILSNTENLKENVVFVVDKVTGIVRELKQTYGDTLENLFNKSAEHVSVSVKVDEGIVPIIKDYIRKNIKILELSRELVPEGTVTPTFLDSEEKVKVLDELFKIEGNVLERYLPRAFTRELVSKDIFFEKDEILRLMRSASSTFYTKFKERYGEEVPSLWHNVSEPNGKIVFAMKRYVTISREEEEVPSFITTISSEKFKLLAKVMREKGANIPDEEVERVSELMDTANLIVETAESLVDGGISEFLKGENVVNIISDSVAKGINEAYGLKEVNELSETVKRIPEANTSDLVKVASDFSNEVKGSLGEVLDRSGIDIEKILDKVQNDLFSAFKEYAESKKIKISETIKTIAERVERLPVGKDLKRDLKEILESGKVEEEDLISIMSYLLFDVAFVNTVILKELLRAVANGSVANRKNAEKILKEALANSILADVPEDKRDVALKNFIEAIKEEGMIPPIVLDLPVGRNTKFGKIFIEAGRAKIDEDEFRLFAKRVLGELGKISGRLALSGALETTGFASVWGAFSDFFRSLQKMSAALLLGSVNKDEGVIRIGKEEFVQAKEKAVNSLENIKKLLHQRFGKESKAAKDITRAIEEAKRNIREIEAKLSGVGDVLDLSKSMELSRNLVNIAAIALSRLFADFDDAEFDEFKALAKNVENLSNILYGYVAFISRTLKMGFVDDLPEIAALVASFSQRGSGESTTASLKLSIVKKAAVGDEIDLEALAEMLYNLAEQNNSVAHYYLLQKVLQAIAIRDSIANGLPIDLTRLLKEFKSNKVFLGLATLQFAINKL